VCPVERGALRKERKLRVSVRGGGLLHNSE
jgi:hypothetical protein